MTRPRRHEPEDGDRWAGTRPLPTDAATQVRPGIRGDKDRILKKLGIARKAYRRVPTTLLLMPSFVAMGLAIGVGFDHRHWGLVTLSVLGAMGTLAAYCRTFPWSG